MRRLVREETSILPLSLLDLACVEWVTGSGNAIKLPSKQCLGTVSNRLKTEFQVEMPNPASVAAIADKSLFRLDKQCALVGLV